MRGGSMIVFSVWDIGFEVIDDVQRDVRHEYE